jgi:HlyD family secretion protein
VLPGCPSSGSLGSVLLVAVMSAACASDAPVPADAETSAGTSADQVIAAAPGRIEGAGEAVELGAGVEGVIEAIRVRAGDEVAAGEALAVLRREDIPAEAAAATASLHKAEAALQRLLRGGRDEERRRATADTVYAEAVVDEARSRYARAEALFAAGAEARSRRDEALRDLRTAEAGLTRAREAATLADRAPLQEEITHARAAVAEAEARVRVAEERDRQRYVFAPFAGTVVRVHMHAGETYSVFAPRPILTLADLSSRSVRAEVDERDTPHISVGQSARIEADGVPVVEGRVSWLSPMMGRKTTRSDDPAEKADRDVREVLVTLSDDTPLPLGHRVTVRFLAR